MSLGLENVDDGPTRRNFETIERLLSVLAEIPFFVNTGDPNGVITASPPALYFNRAGGSSTTAALKVSGIATDTGWEWVQTAP